MKHKIFVVGLEIVEHPSYDLYGYKDKNLLQEETPNKKMIMYMSSWYFYNIYCKRHKEDDLEYLKKFYQNKNLFLLLDLGDELCQFVNTLKNFANPITIIINQTKFKDKAFKAIYPHVGKIFRINALGKKVYNANKPLFTFMKKSKFATLVDNKQLLQKKACFYMGQTRLDRMIVYYYLHNTKLQNECFISFLYPETEHLDEVLDKKLSPYEPLCDNELFFNKFKVYGMIKNANKVLDTQVYNGHHHYITTAHALNSYFSIVIETDMSMYRLEDGMEYNMFATTFLTEKTFKVFPMMHFFIIFGLPGTIDTLRDQGYDVFDDIINHDYDNNYDPAERLIRFIAEVDRLLNISKEEWHEIAYRNASRLYRNLACFSTWFTDHPGGTYSKTCNEMDEYLRGI